MKDLTIYDIQADLANLIEVRDEMQEKGEDLQHIEQAICDYVAKSVKKVDGIRSYIKHAEMMESAAKAESVRLKAVSATWAGRIERLKHFVRFVMEGMEWDEGTVRKLEGKTGSLVLKLDGGKPAVEITQASLIPEELVQYTGTISGSAWECLRRLLSTYTEDNTPSPAFAHWSGRQDVQMERIPHKGRIAVALEKPCVPCAGTGVYNALGDRCDLCGGSGKAVVPGARFAERNSHVEVK